MTDYPATEALRAWLLDQSQQAHYAADHPDGQPGDPGGYFDKGAAHMADGALTQLGTLLESGGAALPAQEPLDVERLAQVFEAHFGPSYFPGLTDVTIIGQTPRAIAEQIAAEYDARRRAEGRR